MPMHHLQRYLKIGLGFVAPLVLTGGAVWGGSGWFTGRVLSQTYGGDRQIDTTGAQPVTVCFDVTVLALDAEIDLQSQVTEISVRTSGSSLQEMEFEYPLVEYADIEQALADDLGLQPADVRALIRYRID